MDKTIVWDDDSYVDPNTNNTVVRVTVDGSKKKFLFTEEVLEDKGMRRCIVFAEDLIKHHQLPDTVVIKNGPRQAMTFSSL